MSPSKYLEQLRSQGHIQESQPLSHAGLQASRAGMSTLDQTIQAEAQIAPPPQSSWRHDVVLPPQPPRRVFVKMPNTSMPKTSLPPVFCFGGLEPGATVGDLVELLWEQLKPGPSTLIRLEHWGSALDESKTLLSCAIADDSSLRLRLVEHTPSEERGLSRLRVTSTALQTRAVAIASRSWTGLDLKERLCAQLGAADVTWWGPEGQATRLTKAATLLSLAKAEEVEGGTSALQKGEELIVDPTNAMILRNAKGTAKARRLLGDVAEITDTQVAFVDLKPAGIRLSFHGSNIEDGAKLWQLGLRQDDAVILEFESPSVPDPLKLLRSPVAEKPQKDKGGKKKKK